MSKQLIPIENWHEYATNEQAFLYEPIKDIYEKYHAKLAHLQHNKYEGYESFICIVLPNGIDAPLQLTQAAVEALKKPPVNVPTPDELVLLQQALQANKKELTKMMSLVTLLFVGLVTVSAYSGYQYVQLKAIEGKLAADLKKDLNNLNGVFVKSADFQSKFEQQLTPKLTELNSIFVKSSDFQSKFEQQFKVKTDALFPKLVTKEELDKRDKSFRDALIVLEKKIPKPKAGNQVKPYKGR